MNQTAHFVTHDLAYHDYEGVALDHDERPRLQKDSATRITCCCATTARSVGRSVASAFERMYHLERASHDAGAHPHAGGRPLIRSRRP
jgi:hypothetical protein